MLGLCTLHLLACAITEFHWVSEWTAIMLCDDKRALSLLSHHKRWIRPSAKCNHIRQSFQAFKQGLSSNFKYVHVYGHMDQHLAWRQLSLPQQLNCVCDTLAKKGGHDSNNARISWHAHPVLTSGRCGTDSLGQQSHWRHHWCASMQAKQSPWNIFNNGNATYGLPNSLKKSTGNT